MSTESVSALIVDVVDRLVLPRFRRLGAGEIAEKSPGDLVTIADREAEAELTAALRAADPDALVIGEEAVAAEPGLRGLIDGAERVWLVDPVDGTGNFVAGNPDFGCMVVELVVGAPVRSWIYQAPRRRMFQATRGAGVRVNGTPLAPPARWSGGRAPRSSSDSAPFRSSSSPEERGACRDAAAPVRPLVGGVAPEYAHLAGPGLAEPWPMTGSCTADYPAIALGERDYLIHNGKYPWDHWPGILLLGELGGRVAFLDGEPFSSTSPNEHKILAAASPEIWDAVAAAARAHGAGPA